MQTIIIHGESQRTSAIELIKNLSLDKPWEVVIKRYRKKRTLSQNALYWKWLEVIGDETGDDKAHLHDVFGRMFLPLVEKTVLGVTIIVPKSTTECDTKEMSEYMGKIQAKMGSEYAIILPHPDDRFYEDKEC